MRRIAHFIIALLILGGLTNQTKAEVSQVELKIGGNISLADLQIAENKKLEDGILVLLHGTLAHKDMELIENLQTMLYERGVSTLAISLTFNQDRRTGMYDCVKPHNHLNEDAIAELDAWIKWLKSKGAKDISLMGHSRGGNQAIWYANEHNTIDRLVLIAPAMAENADETAAAYKKRFSTDLKPILEKAIKLEQQGKASEMLNLPGFIYCADSKASAASVRSYYSQTAGKDTVSLLKKRTSPTLVIAGSADTVVPDVEQKVRAIKAAKNLKLQVIQDAGHMFLDFYSEDAADLVAEFLLKK